MSKLKKIKAEQVAAAKEDGKPNPYGIAEDKQESKKVAVSLAPRRQGKLAKIKAAQMAEAEKTGIDLYAPKLEAKATAPDAISDFAHYQAAMEVDIARIKTQKDLADKAKVKQSVLPNYLPFVDDYVESGDNYPNSVAVQVMIWLLDIAEIEHGLDLALHLVKQNQQMPPRFNRRDIPTFLSDAFYDWGSANLKEDVGVSPYLDTLIIIAEQDEWDMHPLCYSKLYSMLAKHKMRTNDYKQALDLCEKAIAINPEKHGVKGLTAEIKKHLDKAED